MKAMEQYFEVALFVFDIFQNEIHDFFLSFEPFSTLGSERVEFYVSYYYLPRLSQVEKIRRVETTLAGAWAEKLAEA